MDIEYPVKLKLTLNPVQHPWVTVKIDKHSVTQQLTAVTDFDFEFVTADQAILTVEHHDKLDQDPSTAVVIQQIEFYGISDPRFIWAGMYYPKYPTHYPDQTPCLVGQDYLGWNGTYVLKFQVPVFTWMHQIKSLGWLYQ